MKFKIIAVLQVTLLTATCCMLAGVLNPSNSDEALSLAQKIPLQGALQKAKDFAGKSRPYWKPFVATEAEINMEKEKQRTFWVITLYSVNKQSWRQPVAVRIFADGTIDEKPGK